MKKCVALLLAVFCTLTLIGCDKQQPEITLPQAEEKTARIPMVMINGTLYLDTGYNSDTTPRCGTMDGEITSTVAGYQKPTGDNESNFGTGFGYQYGTEGTVEIRINDRWRIFATEEVRKAMQFSKSLTEPPALTVVCGDKSVQAWQGTVSWASRQEDGTILHIEADCLHPLQAKEHMPVLNLIPSQKSSAEPEKAYLLWGVSPDEVTVRCWSEACWGKPDAGSESVSVAGSEEFTIQLKDGNYIYEVIAKWNFPNSLGGSVCYSFCAAKPAMEFIVIQ